MRSRGQQSLLNQAVAGKGRQKEGSQGIEQAAQDDESLSKVLVTDLSRVFILC